MSFRSAIAEIAPPWLQAFVGSRFMHAIGTVIDAIADWMRQSVLARMPGYGTPTALEESGRDRLTPRWPGEPDDEYAARLQAAWDNARLRGNGFRWLDEVRGYLRETSEPPGTTTVRIVSGYGQFPGAAGFSGGDWHVWEPWQVVEADRRRKENGVGQWNWDDLEGYWWRAWVLIFPDPSLGWESAEAELDDGHDLGDGTIIGLGGDVTTEAMISAIRSATLQWRPAGRSIPSIIVCFADPELTDNMSQNAASGPADELPYVDATHTHGRWSLNNAGSQVASRFDDCRYCDGALR